MCSDSIEFSTSTNVNYNGNLAFKEENNRNYLNYMIYSTKTENQKPILWITYFETLLTSVLITNNGQRQAGDPMLYQTSWKRGVGWKILMSN